MKVLLINPPNRNAPVAEYDRAVYENLGAKPPLQLLFLAGYVRRNMPAAEVRILDCQALGYSVEQATQAVVGFSPDVAGITSFTEFWYDTELLIRRIKHAMPSLHITVGGPNAGLFPAILLEHPDIDSVVCGYGEEPVLALLRTLSGERIPAPPGLYFKGSMGKDTAFAWNTFAEKEISQPLPRELLSLDKYASLMAKGISTTMITSKGCPYQCVFCKITQEKFWAYPVEFVINEFRAIQSLGIREVEIYDDTFTTSKERVQEICRRLIEEKIRVEWHIRDRITNSDPGLLKLMKKAGLRRVNYGIEGADDATLARIKKGITVAEVKKAVGYAKAAGLTTVGYFMIGLPGDTEKEFRAILDLSISLGVDYANYSAVIPYPGTSLYAQALARGMFKEDIWAAYVRNPSKDFLIPLYTERHDRKFLSDFVAMSTSKFYFRPSRMLKEILLCGSPAQFLRKARTALTMSAAQKKEKV